MLGDVARTLKLSRVHAGKSVLTVSRTLSPPKLAVNSSAVAEPPEPEPVPSYVVVAR